MKFDLIFINAILFYLKDKNVNKYCISVLIFHLMLTNKN